MIARPPIGKRIAPARFILFGAMTLIAVPLAIVATGWRQGVMIGFDSAALSFLLACLSLLRDGDAATIRRHARTNDANRRELLAMTAVVTLVVLTAVAAELAQADPAGSTVILIVLTLALCWLFSNLVYALHYAHLFYTAEGERDRGGLAFPETHEPDYSDFLYFAATLGMTFQTSDVEIRDRAMRRVVTGHALLAFVFNIGILAFTINVLGRG